MASHEIDESVPVACRMGAIPQEERARWMEAAQELFSSVEEISELRDGYALRLSPDRLGIIGEYVMRERLCCAFVRWEILVEQADGPAWLRIRGPVGTKEFFASAIERLTTGEVE